MGVFPADGVSDGCAGRMPVAIPLQLEEIAASGDPEHVLEELPRLGIVGDISNDGPKDPRTPATIQY